MERGGGNKDFVEKRKKTFGNSSLIIYIIHRKSFSMSGPTDKLH